MMNFNQSALSCDLEGTPKQVSYTPLSAYALPTQSLSSPPSPLPQQVSSKPVQSDAKMASNQSAQYIVCCKCGKRRAVPS